MHYFNKLFFVAIIFWSCLPINSAFSTSRSSKFGPYEKCNWKNKSYTDRLVKDSQLKKYDRPQATFICFNCLKNQLFNPATWEIQRLQNISQGLVGDQRSADIPSMCFLAGTLKARGRRWADDGKGHSYYYCPNSRSNQINRSMTFSNCSRRNRHACTLHEPFVRKVGVHYRNIPIRKPCLNQSYIDMTARAFNKTADCFGYKSLEDKKQLFAVMNHESAFILNKRANPINNIPNTARCYGQIKNGIIEDINKYILYPRPEWKRYKQIYKDVIKKCPSLKSKIISLSGTCQKSTAIKYTACLRKQTNSSALKCQTSQDPYSCLFYTIYNFKNNQVKFDRIMRKKSLNNYKFFNNRLNTDFKLPVQLNEMVSVTGTITVRGVKRKINYVMRDNKEIYSVFGKSHVRYNIKNLKIKKVKLFKKKELKWAFSHLAHNGGQSIITTHLKDFIRNLKYKISINKIAQARKNTIGKYRKSMFNEKPLNMSDLSTMFTHYARTTKRKVSNRKEVSKFLNNINRSLNYLANNKNYLKNSINNLPKKNKQWSDAKTNKWLKRVHNRCPTRLF